MLKLLWAILVVMILGLQWRLWIGPGSLAQVQQMQQRISETAAINTELEAKNQRLYAEVLDLRHADEAIAERARTQLGMVGEDETFFLMVEHAKR